MPRCPTSGDTAAAEFTKFFAEGWSIGATDPERFFAHFGGRMTSDARLVQPLARTVRGPQGMRDLFGPLFAVVPDLRSRILRWGATDDGVLIEHTLTGTLGGTRLSWAAVDRFVLHNDLIAERITYFDPLPLVLTMLRHPRTSVKVLPALFGALRSPSVYPQMSQLDCRIEPITTWDSDDRLVGTWSDGSTTIEIAHESGLQFRVKIDSNPAGIWEKDTARIWDHNPIPPYPYVGPASNSKCASYSDQPRDVYGVVTLYEPRIVRVASYYSPVAMLYLYREVQRTSGAYVSLRLRYFRRLLDASSIAYGVAIDKMLAKR